MPQQQPEHQKKQWNPRAIFGRWVAIGVALGAAIGVAAENIPMGISTGVVLGVTFGAVGQRRRK